MADSNSKSRCLCHRDACKNVGKVACIANAKLGQGLLGVVSTLLQFCGILAIRDTRRDKFSQRQTIVGTVNVLDAADIGWDSKCRVNKSLYAQRVLDFLNKVPRHLFNHFHNSFLLINDDSYEYHNIAFIHILTFLTL